MIHRTSLSPDNFIQAPGFTQSYNRYSYVLNNPLKYTDPSGQITNNPFNRKGSDWHHEASDNDRIHADWDRAWREHRNHVGSTQNHQSIYNTNVIALRRIFENSGGGMLGYTIAGTDATIWYQDQAGTHHNLLDFQIESGQTLTQDDALRLLMGYNNESYGVLKTYIDDYSTGASIGGGLAFMGLEWSAYSTATQKWTYGANKAVNMVPPIGNPAAWAKLAKKLSRLGVAVSVLDQVFQSAYNFSEGNYIAGTVDIGQGAGYVAAGYVAGLPIPGARILAGSMVVAITLFDFVQIAINSEGYLRMVRANNNFYREARAARFYAPNPNKFHQGAK